MSEEDLIAANQNDTGAASSGDEGESPSQTAAEALYPDKVGDEAAEVQEVAEATEAPPPAGAPEKYEFQFAEGQVVDPELLGEFESVAREYNLTNEQAGKLAGIGSKISAKIQQQMIQKQAEQVSKWHSETMSDKEIGGERLNENLSFAKTALNAYWPEPEIKQLLNDSGLGNHPALIRGLVRLGKAISPDSGLPKGKPSAAPKEAKHVLYG